MEKCQLYNQGKAKERKYFQNKMVFCSISEENCPYKKAINFTLLEESVGTICTSSGLVEKIDENAKFDLTKESKIPIKL